MEKQLKQFFKFLETEKKASNNTLQSYKRDLKQFSEYLEENEIKYNKVTEREIKEYLQFLAEQDKKPSTISRTPCILTSKEIELLLEQPTNEDLKGIRDKAMLEFAYASGMRVTEVISLNIEDVNLQEGTVICRSGSKTRIIPLGKLCLHALKEYIENARKILVKTD